MAVNERNFAPAQAEVEVLSVIASWTTAQKEVARVALVREALFDLYGEGGTEPPS